MVISIKEAHRQGAKLLIGLTGLSGGGKTYTAIQLGYGLAGKNAKKLGLLDTENGRGSLYADKLPKEERFLIADLSSPFSPQRYIDAVQDFTQCGVEVLIIDSFSPCWDGEGGCCEIAEHSKLGGLPNWALAKGQHKRLVNALLYSKMHIILCLRARERAKPEEIVDDATGKKKTIFVANGIEPICERNLPYEMTASLILEKLGRRQKPRKCPEDLMPHLGRGSGYITSDDGFAVRQWVEGGAA
jgi:hypothetical protein